MDLANADFVIAPSVTTIHWANFTRAKQCIRRGQQAAEMMMPVIKKALVRKKWYSRIQDGIKYLFEDSLD